MNFTWYSFHCHIFYAKARIIIFLLKNAMKLWFNTSIVSQKQLYTPTNLLTQELNPLYSHGTDYVTHLVEDKSSEIEFSSLTLLDVIGEGAFGKVYKAVLNDSKISHEKDYIVAVKMLKGTWLCICSSIIIEFVLFGDPVTKCF